MKTAGIVAEFNPLHNGHEYIIKETRRMTGCESVLIAMSGDFVQRGEPAFLDKWTRTECALKAGADLVIEIPAVNSLGNASQFASAGVKLLEAAGADEICCGSGSGDYKTLLMLADLITANKNHIDLYIKEQIKKGFSYPVARENAIAETLAEQSFDAGVDMSAVRRVLENPNDVLALEYIMSAEKAKISCIRRVGAGYNDAYDVTAQYQSAGGIRKLFENEDTVSALEKAAPYLPVYSLEALKSATKVFPNDFVPTLRYAVMRSSVDNMESCPSGGEGLANLIKSAILSNDGWNDIIMTAKSKRYTYTRLSRLCMQIILGINRDDFTNTDPEYMRVLGFTENGRKILSEIKKDCVLPIISNVNKDSRALSDSAQKKLKLDIMSADIYNLVSGRDMIRNSDYRHSPVIFSAE